MFPAGNSIPNLTEYSLRGEPSEECIKILLPGLARRRVSESTDDLPSVTHSFLYQDIESHSLLGFSSSLIITTI